MIFQWNLANDTLVYPDLESGKDREITIAELRACGWKVDEIGEMRMRRELPRFTQGRPFRG